MDQWNPHQYEKYKDQRAQPFFDLLKMIHPVSGPSVVDLGCGTGELTRVLHEKLGAAKTLGIDSSEKMLEKSKQHVTAHLQFQNQDLRSFVPDEKFDLVFSNAALQWVEHHENFFPRIFEWLKPHGQVAVQVPQNYDHPSHRVAAEIAQTLFPTQLKKETPHVLSIEQYSEMLFENGFADQECLSRIYAHPMASGYDVVEWTKGTLLTRYQSQLNETDYQRFLKEYTRELIFQIGEGPYFYGFKRILLWGKRK